MLDELLVRNLGIIAEARVEPGPGLVALTGETGAGKTLLLGALRLLRGDQARTDRVGPHDDEARVEGRFLLPDGSEATLARRVTSSRSRAYVDGSMTPVGALADRLDGLVEIVGQHEHVGIGRRAEARAIVDGRLDPAGREAADRYARAWARLQALRADQDDLGGDRRVLERDRELTAFQADEIADAGLEPGEDDALDTTLGRLRHGEEIAESLGAARDRIAGDDGAEDLLRATMADLRRVAVHDPEIEHLVGRLEGLVSETADVAVVLRELSEGLDRDPRALQEAERRKAVLTDLIRKYGASVDEVIAYGEAARERADRLGGLLERADRIAEEIRAAEADVDAAGEELRDARRRAAKELAGAAVAHLRDLGFGDPLVEIVVEPNDPAPHGADVVEIRFASDASLGAGPVGRIASGGELSRLVLAIRLAAGIGDAPVVAFDEIDAGVGGATALAMGEKLAALAQGRQVFVVTHLPQIAAFADTQVAVRREGSSATVTVLDDDDRRGELARMLGGLGEAEGGLLHADELVAEAARRRGTG